MRGSRERAIGNDHSGRGAVQTGRVAARDRSALAEGWTERGQHFNRRIRPPRLVYPGNADGYWIRGYTLTYKGDLSAGREQFELALKSNPNHADAWVFLADLEVYEGHPDCAVRAVERAFQLNPYPHATYYWLKGFALYAARQYEEAVGAQQHESCRGTGSQRILAAASAQLGRYPEAREVTRQFLVAFPDFSLSVWAKTQPFPI